MSTDTQNIKKEVQRYLLIFGALLLLTVITVVISGFHFGAVLAVTLALIVAATKASLVAGYFMHLTHERKLIYVVMGFTMFFFIGMIILMIGSYHSVPEGGRDLNLDYVPVEQTDTQPHNGGVEIDHNEPNAANFWG